ncbi:MAG: hypothetical protein AAFQ98_20025 [Bacteroidota bacterium]
MLKKDLELQRSWQKMREYIGEHLGRRPKDLNGVLFMIGVQELGQGPRPFSKEEKQDLMHIAICKVLSYSGFYELEGLDEQGWPHWKNTKPLPKFDVLEQEKLLKMHVLEYFEKELEVKF